MEVNLTKRNLDYITEIFSVSEYHEEFTEINVADVLPDIKSISFSDAKVLIRGREFTDKSIVISGIISATVVYNSEIDDRKDAQSKLCNC